MSDDNQQIAAGDTSDAARRARLRRLLVKGAFAAPVIASTALGVLTIDKAAAQTNTTASKGGT